MTTITTKELALRQTYSATVDNLPIEIVHWGIERGGFSSMNNGKGCWNYYIYIHERFWSNFSALWLTPEIKRFSEERESSEYLSYNEHNSPVNVDSWHGGITLYEQDNKRPHNRFIKIGCDYSHLFDMERGYNYDLNEVLADCLQTCKELLEVLVKKE